MEQKKLIPYKVFISNKKFQDRFTIEERKKESEK